MILLDTCVVSEVVKPNPSQAVMVWADGLPEDQVWLPVMVLAEMHRGVAMMDAGRKRDALELWLAQLEDRFQERLADFDLDAARAWGQMQATASSRGRAIPVQDSLIAAIALSRSATLATRNTGDFAGLGFAVVNPWQT